MNVRVDGFNGCNCKNQLTGVVAPESQAINIIDQEVDNIYLNTRSLSGEYDIGDITLLEDGTKPLIVSKQSSYILPESIQSDSILDIPVDVASITIELLETTNPPSSHRPKGPVCGKASICE